ncbi:MAG TPA: sulfite exporter TauE/SafE family protein [Deltaproteobacteria bacterium]|nr:sulfite exporter TauE/SafE family protein [Deltaproteobacteria bacterium]
MLNIFLLVLGGGVAGFINTLAGGGSFLTIPLLIFMGLPPTVANATNRIGVFLQSLTATRQLHSHGVFPVRFSLIIAIPAVLGSVLGTYGAMVVSDAAFKKYLAVFMVLMTLITFFKPAAMLSRPEGKYSFARWSLLWLLFFGIGLYGGFIQAGVGFLIIAATVLTGYDLVAGNAIKSFVIFLLTCVSLAIFWFGGKVQVAPGLALGCGSMLGAFVGSHVTVSKGNGFIQKFVVVMVILSAILLMLK